MLNSAEVIKTLRSRAGMTQGDLAKAIGVTSAAVSAWETGRASPQMDRFIAICKVAGYEIKIVKTYTKYSK